MLKLASVTPQFNFVLQIWLLPILQDVTDYIESDIELQSLHRTSIHGYCTYVNASHRQQLRLLLHSEEPKIRAQIVRHRLAECESRTRRPYLRNLTVVSDSNTCVGCRLGGGLSFSVGLMNGTMTSVCVKWTHLGWHFYGMGGISFHHRTHMVILEGNPTVLRYRDEVLVLITIPFFIINHHIAKVQQGNARCPKT